MPEMVRRIGQDEGAYGGHWMTELLAALSRMKGFQVGVVSAFPGLSDEVFEKDGITYFMIGQPRRYPAFGERAADLARCVAAVNAFQPDLIHFHGSERFYGRIKTQGVVKVPAVVSLQGLLGPYSTVRNFFGALSCADALRSVRPVELPLRLGILWDFLRTRRGARREAEIIAAMDAILGRTTWDRAHAAIMNPAAPYFHVDEILRPVFNANPWSISSCRRHSMIYTNAGHPRRGTEDLLSAVVILRHRFPDVRLRLGGTVSARSGYGRFLSRRIAKLGVTANVEFIGYVNSDLMVRELREAHVFAIASYIENSPNSLAEAMAMGMPCVASYVGGIPDMIHDRETGLFYPAGDAAMLAQRISNIFEDDALASRLGENARRVALVRHDPRRVVDQLCAAYASMMSRPVDREPSPARN